MKGKVAVALVMAFAVAGCGDDDASGGPSREEVQDALETAVDAGAPGIAVEIRGPDGEEFLTAGLASLEPRRSISTKDHFRIASVTKSFTAAIVMQLVADGKLSLDDTVEEAAPGLLPASEPTAPGVLQASEQITIRNLLAHTSGLADYVELPVFAEIVGAGEPLPPEEVLELIADERLEFPPGSRYDYSDSDNIVLGFIIEAVTGRSFEQELRSRLIEPLGLDQTTLATKIGVLPQPHVEGYQFEPDNPEPVNVTDVPLDPNGAWASGALISTPDDVATFFQSLLGGEIVDRDQLEKMMEGLPGKGLPPGPGRHEAGLGIFRWSVPCGDVWGHTGAFPGFRALGGADEGGDRAIAFLVNATDLPEATEAAVLDAQELAICRALGKDAG